MTAGAASLSPGARRTLLTVCTMTATIMQALDTTIANVAPVSYTHLTLPTKA